MTSILISAQNNNPASIYEGSKIQQVDFSFVGAPSDTVLTNSYRNNIEREFGITPHIQYNAILASYYTLKYFHSRQWYFHLNVAYALAGSAVRDNLSLNSKNWFCATVFARYSF